MSTPSELFEKLKQAKAAYVMADENFKKIELELDQASDKRNEARRAAHRAWKDIQDATGPIVGL